MKKHTDIIFIIIIMLILSAPLVLMDNTEGAVSDADGRTLVSAPVYGEDGYTAGVETYIRDRAAYRDELVDYHAELNDSLFDELINPTYQYGRDGYTYFKLHNNIRYSGFHTEFTKMIAYMNGYCESRGSKFYYVFNPEKESVYSQYLPEGVNYDDLWADMIMTLLDRMGVNYIDLRDTLGRMSNDDAVFNRLVDAGHWNHTGAFYGMQAITERINSDIPAVRVLDESEYDIAEIINEKIYNSNQIFNEETKTYALKAGYTDITGDIKSEIRINDQHSYIQIIQNESEEASGINRLLLFEDDLFAPFAFARSKEMVVMTCLQNAVNFEYYYNIFKPDVVLFENMEYVVSNNYFSESAMSALDPNPGIIELFPEKGFSRRVSRLLKSSRKYKAHMSVLLKPQTEIDKIYLSRIPAKCKYAYLITDNTVYDLLRDDTGLMYADIRHGELTDGSNATLYIINEEGEGRYDTVTITAETEDIELRLNKMTSNITPTDAGDGFVMTTQTEGNTFNRAVVQFFNKDLSKYLRELGSMNAVGHAEGVFTNDRKSGYYKVLLRANSNLNDEWLIYDVYLEKGRTYKYSFELEELTPESITVSGFRISVPVA